MKDMYNSNLLLYYKLCDNASEFMCLLRAPAQLTDCYSVLLVDYRCIEVILTKRMKVEVK